MLYLLVPQQTGIAGRAAKRCLHESADRASHGLESVHCEVGGVWGVGETRASGGGRGLVRVVMVVTGGGHLQGNGKNVAEEERLFRHCVCVCVCVCVLRKH